MKLSPQKTDSALSAPAIAPDTATSSKKMSIADHKQTTKKNRFLAVFSFFFHLLLHFTQ
jgi:hypothetical protein